MKGYKVNKDNIFSITEARRRIFDLAEEVQEPGSYYVLTEHGKPKVVMMSSGWFESLIETIELLEDFPMLDKEIREAREAFTTGKTVALENMLTQHMCAADKGGTYAVPRRSVKKRAKRTRKNKQKRSK